MELEHSEVVRNLEQELADKNLELAAMKTVPRDKIRRIGVGGEEFRRAVGLVSCCLATLGLVIAYITYLYRSLYIQETSVAMIEAGQASMVGAMITFNFIVEIFFVVQSLALLAIGIGQFNNWAWAGRSAFLWSILAFVYIAIDVMGTKFIEGQSLPWVVIIVLLSYPIFLLVFRKRIKN